MASDAPQAAAHPAPTSETARSATTGQTRSAGPTLPARPPASDRFDIHLPSDLDAASTARLGDRLVQALAGETGRIVLWIAGRDGPSPEVTSLVNSLGRYGSRTGGRPTVELRGSGPAFRALAAAYRQGLAGKTTRRKQERPWAGQ